MKRRLSLGLNSVLRYLTPVVVAAAFFISLGQPVQAQLSVPHLTECDIEALIFQHPAYDTCDPDFEYANFCATTVLTGSERAEQVFNFLVGKGMTPIQTAGVMGNLSVESNFDPGVEEHSGGGGFGIAQWTGGRRTALEQAASKKGVSVADLGFQLDYLYQEAKQRGDWDGMLAQNDIRSATFYWEDHFERPRDRHQEERVRRAQGFLAQYGSGSGNTAPVSSPCSDATTAGPSGDCSAQGVAFKDQYSETQLRQVFGAPARDNPGSLVTANFLGNSVQVHRLVAPCLEAVSNELIANGVTYRPDPAKQGIGCYRANDGQIGNRSYHVYGAACDINALTNNYFKPIPSPEPPYDPNCPAAASAVNSGRCYDIPMEYVSAFAHHGFTWGGNWTSAKDYMHFEWHGVNP